MATHARGTAERRPDDDHPALLETRLRVLTWNLWWRFGPWEQRLEAIRTTIAAVDPDIACLQEVWVEEGRSTADVLADDLGFEAVHAARLDLDGVGFGNAVISRWPIEGHEWRPLPAPAEHEELRTVLRADVAGPRGTVQAFSTHLHWRLDHSHVRAEQVRAICELVASSPRRTYPAVLCGDFNAEPDADEIRMLTGKAAVPRPPVVFLDAWRHVHRDGRAGFTWSNDNPFAARDLAADSRIDYVFVGYPKAGGAGHPVHAELVGTAPIEGVWPSDHFGVVAELRY